MTDCVPYARVSEHGRLTYRVRGDLSGGTPILLNRPLGGTMELWGEFADQLSEFHPLIMFDPRGVGCSSRAPLSHSTRAMARDAVELLDVLAVPRAHVFGLSLGGMVATWIAVDAPDRVAKLVLGSTFAASRAIKLRALETLLHIGMSALMPGVEAEIALVDGILSPEFRLEQRERTRAIERSIRASPTTSLNLIALAFAAARHDARRCLPHVLTQTLLLCGDRDPIAGGAMGRLRACLPHARLEMIPGSGHDLSLEAPKPTAARIVAFLRDDAADRSQVGALSSRGPRQPTG